ncbi:MAG: Bifunctional ligase/repressor BirA [Syntrophorhabdaceae bacterium PtaU1.Bin034]|nr:MAG: Bifunctional ligase/repressor BirA [Syntrophorhabdaceae bacterium PtaU1.Bin034]
MNRTREILGFLQDRSGYVSGTSIASQLQITRTAVWKYLKQLEEMGYVFDKLKGKGYRLRFTPDRLFPWQIEPILSTRFIGREIVYKDSVDSTNVLAFKLALGGCKEGTCVIAETQSAGRGRLQRKWHSPYARNLYLSVVLRPELHPSRVYPLTFISSLAAFDTVKAAGAEPRLKWPNDVLIQGKKICGTLIELSTEADRVRFVVIGIGLNVNMEKEDMDPEIADRATSLLMETKKRFERTRICGILLGNLERYYEIGRQEGMSEICRLWEERARTKGTYMEIVQTDRTYRGISHGIDEDGAVLLEENGKVARVIAGDASV